VLVSLVALPEQWTDDDVDVVVVGDGDNPDPIPNVADVNIEVMIVLRCSPKPARALMGVQSPVVPDQRLADLTAREREVLRFLLDGMSNSEIAVALTVTERTVKYHVSNILQKFGARNRRQLIAGRPETWPRSCTCVRGPHAI
jgi:DNA-binding NarL/FixJ family response regulator